jgi:hypothetical protein
MQIEKPKTQDLEGKFKSCSIKMLPEEKRTAASHTAEKINPNNRVEIHQLRKAFPDVVIPVEHLAVLVSKRWPTSGVSLTVGFLDNPPIELRARILSHMNAWAAYCKVSFVETNVNPQVRISRTAGDGYWSYLGTDILHVDANEPTMNLDSFSMDTEDSEFFRVVRHETGHTLGFPHEHMRREIVAEIDKEKAIAYFERDQHWSRQEVINQVLTPIDESALLATEHADVNSIMCYWLPAEIMKTKVSVPGGKDIDGQDARFAETVYPK